MTNFQRDLEVIINEVGIVNNGNMRFIIQYPSRLKGNIAELGLCDRSYNALRRNRIQFIQEISEFWTDFDLLKGIGAKCKKEIKNAYMAFYYDQLSVEEQKDFWRETIKATEELAGVKSEMSA